MDIIEFMKYPTEKLFHIETIIINGEEFSIEEIERFEYIDEIERLEYSGEWVRDGYLVTRKKNGTLKTFRRYPIESDIKNKFDIK